MPRAPTKRQSDDDPKALKIPRPPNAWIIYRTQSLKEWREARSPNEPPVKQADISRIIAARWKAEPDPVKLEFEKRAAIAKAEHRKLYPDYKYNPISKEAKDKMRAEEREAKKRAKEEAKAAKAAARVASYSSQGPSYPSPPSGSNVKLEALEEKKRSPRPREPVDRGCGPSPPIDYDPQSPSSLSSASLSASSSASVRSSPLPSSTHPALDANDAPRAWLPRVPSPLSSSPTHLPPPAYPAGLVHSPVPSRQSSYTLLTSSFPPSSSSSTPSDSPPSYTEGDGWQSQPPSSGYPTFTPLPDLQHEWDAFNQYEPLLQPDVQFSIPTADPLVASAGGEQLNFEGTNLATVFDLSVVQTASLQSPPGELDVHELFHEQQLLQAMNAVDGGFMQNPADQLAPMMDMAELHETVHDHAMEAGIPVPDSSQPWTFEDLATWVNTHQHEAMNFADPNFYLNLSLEVAAAYPDLNPAIQVLPPPTSFNADQVLLQQDHHQPVFDAAMFQMFVQQPELAMPVPTLPVPAPVQTEATSAHAAAQVVQPAPPTEAPSAASAPQRYVPPSGAGMQGRRRVAYRFDQRMPHFGEDSD